MALPFGTDGVRGTAFVDLTVEDVSAIGRAAAEVVAGGLWLIGRDTRESGPVFARALAAGLAAGGAEPMDLGVAPTPAVAFAAQRAGACGAVLSASHNPWSDNGVKLFGAGGRKLDDDQQQGIARRLDEFTERSTPTTRPVAVVQTPLDDYAHHLHDALEGRRLDGLSIVIDCAHGAASEIAGPIFGDLGARVQVIHAEPDGRNINDGCGSTDPRVLADTVVSSGADLGIAVDGDADRLVAVDGSGQLIDGDHLMAMFAVDLLERKRLASRTLVVTVMSNLGLRRAMDEAGVTVVETPVGDRAVLEALDRQGLSLGGEQSGHLIFRDLATTGDGLLSGVLLADLMKRQGRSSRDLRQASMTTCPQVLLNVDVDHRPTDVEIAGLLEAEVAEATARLGDAGRVLVRPSGTEPVVRVMVEATVESTARLVAQTLAAAVSARFG